MCATIHVKVIFPVLTYFINSRSTKSVKNVVTLSNKQLHKIRLTLQHIITTKNLEDTACILQFGDNYTDILASAAR